MARIDILGINKLKWTEWVNLTQVTIISTTVGKNLLEEMSSHYSHHCVKTMKRQKNRTLKSELPRSIGTQYATGDQWRNNYRKNEDTEPKQNQHQVAGVTGDRSKVQCPKEQYYTGTWNVRSMNQGKLDVVKQEMARVNVDILGISE